MTNQPAINPQPPSDALQEWTCLRVEPRKEFKVYQALLSLAAIAYLPICRAHSNSRYFPGAGATVPLFPSYLFSEPLTGDQDLALRRKLGFTGKHSCASIGMVDSEIISEIRAREDHQGYVKLSSHNARPDDYQQDEELDISAGPFAGNTALFARREGERIYALMQLFGQMREVQFTERQLRRAEL